MVRSTRNHSSRTRRHTFRPRLDALEERRLLSIFVVNTVSDLDRAGGLPVGQQSLRQAIEDVNADTANTAADTIDFDIGNGGHQAITLASPLPAITNTVTIDGTTQPGYSGSPLVEINGGGISGDGLQLQGANSVVRGLVVNNVSGTAIDSTGVGTVIQGNYVGTDWTGTVAATVGSGIVTSGANSLIGGTSPGEGNLISGSLVAGINLVLGATIQGNKIGTDITGTKGIPNYYGIRNAFASLIGGTDSGAGNLISGNGWANIEDSNTDVIQGNFIGTDITGKADLVTNWDAPAGYDGSHTLSGMEFLYSSTIGGTTPAARNIISGNGYGISNSGGDLIEGNYIGTDVTGEVGVGVVGAYGLINAGNDTIGGTAAGAGNLISGLGVGIGGADGCLIQGNFIGTNKGGTKAVRNEQGMYWARVWQSLGDTIGGTAAGAGNLISGNRFGIHMSGGTGSPVATNVIIQGNWIGTDITGSGPLGNGDGIFLSMGVSDNLIGGTTPGSGNVIAYNNAGVVIASKDYSSEDWRGDDGYGNSILGNSFHGNSFDNYQFMEHAGEIVLIPNPDNPQQGPNGLQAAPVLTPADAGVPTTVTGSLRSSANNTFRIEFFASPGPDAAGKPQGERYLGFVNVMTDGTGYAPINATGLGASSVGEAITATATSPTGDTSEFSQDVQVTQALTTNTLSSSANPSLLNQPVTFTATITTPIAGPGTPTGTVQFIVDNSSFGGPVALSGGSASISISNLPVGSHTIQAAYSGDSLFLGSSGSLTQAVQYRFSGFLPPLSTGVSYALGRAIPVKFTLADYSNAAIASLTAVKSLLVAPVNSDGSLATPFVPASSDGKNLTYAGGQYLLNWKTTGLTAGSYQVQLCLADGTTQTKTVQLKVGGGAAGLLADTTGTSTAATAGALLGGDLTVAVNDPNGLLTADERARISDAISTIDLTVAPYGVTITQIDPSSGLADVTIDTSSTSAVGGYANGVLGCESGTEVTLIQGWNWYAGADPTAISTGQFDFETVVMHELGHVLGLGHRADATSVMYATLGAGTANRNLTAADLNVPDDDGGAPAGLHARVPRAVVPTATSTATAPPSLSQNVGLMAWDAAVADLFPAGLTRTQRKRT